MEFFAPRPDPQASAADEPYYADPRQEPANALPGFSGVGITLARSQTTALQLSLAGSYPQGLALAVRARLHPDHAPGRSLPPLRHDPFEDLRIGLQWPDGTRCEADTQWCLPDRDNGAYHLTSQGSGGGDLTYNWNWWLWPLPPPGPVTVHLLWEQRGLPETATVVDLTPFVASAAEATVLWPLPDPPPDTDQLLQETQDTTGFSNFSISSDASPTDLER